MENELHAIVLAAGKGTRMKSRLPKVLHEIFSRPLVSWVLRSVENLPYQTKSTVVVGFGSDKVEEFLNKNHPSSSIVLQKEQLGTAHAVSQTIPKIEDFMGNVIILCGDTPLITTETLSRFIKFHRENNSDVTAMTCDMSDPSGLGRIVRDNSGEFLEIREEKDATPEIKALREINAGIYCLNWQKILPAFSEIKNNNAQGEYYLTDIIKWAKQKNMKALAYKISDEREVFGINSRSQLACAFNMMNEKYLEYLMREGVTITDPDNTYISPETTIEPDTIIYPSVYIEGKNKISTGCKIGPMAHLRGNCELEENVKIGNFVELKNAKIAKNSHVCHLTYVGDAKIGKDVNVGAGTIFANYNSITKEKKMTTVQDNASIGSNSVLVAPVEIGEGALLGAMSCITKNVEANSLALTRTPQREVKNWVTNYSKQEK